MFATWSLCFQWHVWTDTLADDTYCPKEEMQRVPEIETMPEVVYHYTTMDAMMNIVKSRCIWATSISYLNDVSERELFLNAVQHKLPAFTSNHSFPVNQSDGEDDDSFDMGPNSIGVDGKPFVASFSTEPDSLMHWRSYCPHGNGVSIGFRTEYLMRATCNNEPSHPLLAIPPAKFGKVSYVAPTDSSSIDKSMEKAYEMANQTLLELSHNEEFSDTSLMDLFNNHLEDMACFHKDNSFAVETEYRLMLSSLYLNWEVLRFRSTRSTLVPYIELSIPNREPQRIPNRGTYPIKAMWGAVAEIIIGPTTNMSLSMEAVHAFLLSQRIWIDVKRRE